MLSATNTPSHNAISSIVNLVPTPQTDRIIHPIGNLDPIPQTASIIYTIDNLDPNPETDWIIYPFIDDTIVRNMDSSLCVADLLMVLLPV